MGFQDCGSSLLSTRKSAPLLRGLKNCLGKFPTKSVKPVVIGHYVVRAASPEGLFPSFVLHSGISCPPMSQVISDLLPKSVMPDFIQSGREVRGLTGWK